MNLQFQLINWYCFSAWYIPLPNMHPPLEVLAPFLWIILLSNIMYTFCKSFVLISIKFVKVSNCTWILNKDCINILEKFSKHMLNFSTITSKQATFYNPKSVVILIQECFGVSLYSATLNIYFEYPQCKICTHYIQMMYI